MTDIFAFITPQPWMKLGSCVGHEEPDLWYDSGEYIRRNSHSPATQRAIAICLECPVRAKCAQYALDNDEYYGVWAGLTPHDRAVVRRARRREGAA